MYSPSRLASHLLVEAFCDGEVFIRQASSQLLLLLQATHQLELLPCQVINMLLQGTEVVAFGSCGAGCYAVCQGCMRA